MGARSPAHQQGRSLSLAVKPTVRFAPEAKLGLALSGAVVVAAVLALARGGSPPSVLTTLTVCLQSALLIGVPHRDGTRPFGRLGFHVGLFAFFLSYPLLVPWMATAGLPVDVLDRLDLALLLTLVGFECGYAVGPHTRRPEEALPSRADSRGSVLLLRLLVVVGVASWAAALVEVSRSADAGLDAVLFTMRGPIEGVDPSGGPSLPYVSFVLGGGMWLSAVAATLLITSPARVGKATRSACWLVLVVLMVAAFLRGSRAVFLYGVIPLSSVIWLQTGRAKLRGIRLAGAAALAALVGASWGAMAAMRGGDIRQYQGEWAELNPGRHVEGAFNVYSATAEIVAAFPSEYPYELGRSLVPLVLGWVPRPLWPGKPYPFGMYANYLRGETLESRSASLAVGLTGEGYGNFGLVGSWLWGALLGLACVWSGHALARLGTARVLELQLAGFGAVCVAMIVRGGVPEMFYMGLGVGLWPLLLALIMRRSAIPQPGTHRWRAGPARRAS